MKHNILLFLSLTIISSNVIAQVQRDNIDLVGQISLKRSEFDHPSDVYVKGNYAYVLFIGNLSIVDVSNPKNPVEVSRFEMTIKTGDHSWDVYIADKYAYVTDPSGIHIIDVSDPKKPVEVCFYPYDPSYIFVSGKYAYVSNRDSLLILDVSDPKNPEKKGICYLPSLMPWRLYVAGDYVYLINRMFGFYIM